MATGNDPAAGQPFPLPSILTHPSSAPPVLITQGAEGRLYKTTFLLPDLPCALKYRPAKPWRHPVLDRRLTRARILAEAKVLQRCRRDGVSVPALYAVFEGAGCMLMEWIEGGPVRACINEWLGARRGADEKTLGDHPALLALLRRMGEAVGGIHQAGIIHGDLTTSNMMLRPWMNDTANGHAEGEANTLNGDIVIIDFGLATTSVTEEDRAVDLYVLERAFASTHPQVENSFPEVLKGYKAAFKQAGPTLRRLEDVRMRGRKRSMLG
jgi:TP53 regulating kinase and related kinases